MRFYESLNEDWKFAKTDQVPDKMPCPGNDQDWEWVDPPHSWNNWDRQAGGEGGMLTRGSYNYTFAVYDPDEYTLYYQEFDT